MISFSLTSLFGGSFKLPGLKEGLFLSLFFTLFIFPVLLVAQEREERHFSGSFAEFSLRGGPSVTAGELGYTVDAGFRNSMPFYLTDNRLSYRYNSGGELDVDIHGLHFNFGLHPLYLTLLGGSLISHFLASLHLELGIGGQMARFREEEASRFAPGLSWSLGTGFDLPLTNPNRGQGFWLHVVYRHSWTTLHIELDDNSIRLSDHSLFGGLGWRINGGFW